MEFLLAEVFLQRIEKIVCFQDNACQKTKRRQFLFVLLNLVANHINEKGEIDDEMKEIIACMEDHQISTEFDEEEIVENDKMEENVYASDEKKLDNIKENVEERYPPVDPGYEITD